MTTRDAVRNGVHGRVRRRIHASHEITIRISAEVITHVRDNSTPIWTAVWAELPPAWPLGVLQ